MFFGAFFIHMIGSCLNLSFMLGEEDPLARTPHFGLKSQSDF